MKCRRHYIMTRFNLGIYQRYGVGERATEWMTERLRLFEKYCVPSLVNQACKSFKFVIFVDSMTDRSSREGLERILLCSDLDYSIIYCDWNPSAKWQEKDSLGEDGRKKFIELARSECSTAIMTRLDNDDALSKHYVEICQNEIKASDRREFVVDFRYGAMLDIRNKECWSAEHAVGSPFITLVEKVSEKMGTVYYSYHRKVASVYGCEQSDGKNNLMWMMIIHDRNTTNRMFEHMKIRKIEYDSIRKDFGC